MDKHQAPAWINIDKHQHMHKHQAPQTAGLLAPTNMQCCTCLEMCHNHSHSKTKQRPQNWHKLPTISLLSPIAKTLKSRFLFVLHSTVHCIYLIMLLIMNKISSSSSSSSSSHYRKRYYHT